MLYIAVSSQLLLVSMPPFIRSPFPMINPDLKNPKLKWAKLLIPSRCLNLFLMIKRLPK